MGVCGDGGPKDKEESGSQTIRPGSSPREQWTEKLERTGFELDLEIDERSANCDHSEC